LHSWLNRIWYDGGSPPWWLLPPAELYGAITALRRHAYAMHLRSSTRLSRPVIVIGNLSAGGTGKTPLVCWMAGQLAQLGLKPGVVARGYGGSSRHARLVSAGDDAGMVGDESLLLARRTGVPVAVGRDRPAAAQLLIDAGCDVIVSDDGLQHYALARDCEVVVIDGERCFGNGRLLPAGPLREAPDRLASVDAIVINGGSAAGEGGVMRPATLHGGALCPVALPPGAMTMTLAADRAIDVAGGEARALSDLAGETVHAVAAIGNPQRFFDMLSRAGMTVIPHPLPDHAPLAAGDITFADDLRVLMTEKDAVKCTGFAGAQHWCVPASVSFESDGGAQFLEIVSRCLASWCDATRSDATRSEATRSGATRSMNKPAEGNHG
jgi:tetraacyldisaccharide 4'-kinase